MRGSSVSNGTVRTSTLVEVEQRRDGDGRFVAQRVDPRGPWGRVRSLGVTKRGASHAPRRVDLKPNYDTGDDEE